MKQEKTPDPKACDTSSQDIHQSNDAAGGQQWKPGQSVQADQNPVHESNDVAGGMPKSPAGANRLAGDRKMDDDTGFSRG